MYLQKLIMISIASILMLDIFMTRVIGSHTSQRRNRRSKKKIHLLSPKKYSKKNDNDAVNGLGQDYNEDDQMQNSLKILSYDRNNQREDYNMPDSNFQQVYVSQPDFHGPKGYYYYDREEGHHNNNNQYKPPAVYPILSGKNVKIGGQVYSPKEMYLNHIREEHLKNFLAKEKKKKRGEQVYKRIYKRGKKGKGKGLNGKQKYYQNSHSPAPADNSNSMYQKYEGHYSVPSSKTNNQYYYGAYPQTQNGYKTNNNNNNNNNGYYNNFQSHPNNNNEYSPYYYDESYDSPNYNYNNQYQYLKRKKYKLKS